jgi:hypothetical protein
LATFLKIFVPTTKKKNIENCENVNAYVTYNIKNIRWLLRFNYVNAF